MFLVILVCVIILARGKALNRLLVSSRGDNWDGLEKRVIPAIRLLFFLTRNVGRDGIVVMTIEVGRCAKAECRLVSGPLSHSIPQSSPRNLSKV